MPKTSAWVASPASFRSTVRMKPSTTLRSREVARAREQWRAGERFGEVHGYAGPRLEAPALPATPLKPCSRER